MRLLIEIVPKNHFLNNVSFSFRCATAGFHKVKFLSVWAFEHVWLSKVDDEKSTCGEWNWVWVKCDSPHLQVYFKSFVMLCVMFDALFGIHPIPLRRLIVYRMANRINNMTKFVLQTHKNELAKVWSWIVTNQSSKFKFVSVDLNDETKVKTFH